MANEAEKRTFGENLVSNLLKGLPKGKYYWFKDIYITAKSSAFHEPDFVIAGSRLGVVVLEVKDYKKITQFNRREIVIERSNGEIATERNPVYIAEEYAHNLAKRLERTKQLLKSYKGKLTLKFPWLYAAVLPHIKSEQIRLWEEQGIVEEGQILGKAELTPERFETAILNIPGAWKLDKPLSNKEIDLIRSIIDPTEVTENLVEDKSGNIAGIVTTSQNEEIRRPLKVPSEVASERPLPLDILSNETSQIAEDADVRLVRGVAGSGKSLVLARRAQYLAQNYPDLSILILAFNRDLTEDLRRRIPGAPNLEITNFHKMCSKILGRKWQSPISIEDWLSNNLADLIQRNGFSPDFIADEIEWRKEFDIYDGQKYLEAERKGRGSRLPRDRREIINTIFDQYIRQHDAQQMIDWADVPFSALAELDLRNSLKHTYDVILIDEAQDFAPSWIRVVKALLKPGGALFMCDDPTQSLFRYFSWREKGVEVTGRTRVLRVPFRSTREITIAAHSLIHSDSTLSQSEEIIEPNLTSYELESGDLPLISHYRDLQDEVRGVEQQVSVALQAGHVGGQIAILCHNRRLIRHWAHLRDKGVYVSSFNTMKGLEFQTVLIPHIQTVFERTDAPKDDTFVTEARRRIFTAMTRAREKLIMSYHGSVLPSEFAVLEGHVQYNNPPMYQS